MGPADHGFDAWCEACQASQVLPQLPGDATRCAHCGALLATAPRFVELWGMLQHLDAVLAAWAGDATPLATLLPERPVFLTDLTPPPARAGDPEPLRAQLAVLARGDWAAVVAATAGTGPLATSARAIAHERMGDVPAAIAAWDGVLAAGEDERARLARGSLLARTGRFAEARADLERAGSSFAARWSRAALLITSAVAVHPGMPDRETLDRARTEAGAPSAYWSDPTVGRLLWTLLVARVGRSTSVSAGSRALLRAAEAQLEHESFWDRSLVLVGWVRVGAPDEAARVAQPLAAGEVQRVAREPALSGEPLADVARDLVLAQAAIDAREPARARAALARSLARADLQRFRLPCARCGRGTIGVDEVLEASAEGA